MTHEEWMASRAPRPPAELADRLGALPDRGRRSEALARAAARALERATARTGRDREAAFTLLAADALASYACEAALEAQDPRAELRDVLEQLCGRGAATDGRGPSPEAAGRSSKFSAPGRSGPGSQAQGSRPSPRPSG